MKNNLTVVTILIVFCLFSSVFSQTKEGQLASVASDPNMMNITEDIIQQRVEMYLLKNYSENHKEVVISFDPFQSPVLVDRVDWEIKVDSRYNKVKNGINLVEVTIFSKKEIYKKFNVKARLSTFDDIVVASTMLDREQKITEDMIALEQLETTNFKRDYFITIEDILGLQTKQIVNPGKPIFTSMVELPDIIMRGDVVKILVKMKNMEVKATGTALQNGKRGERIRVQNKSTGKKLTAEVIDEKTVLIEL